VCSLVSGWRYPLCLGGRGKVYRHLDVSAAIVSDRNNGAFVLHG
jgi:hypothetical protein